MSCAFTVPSIRLGALIVAGLIALCAVLASPADAGHRCGHKRVCVPPPPPPPPPAPAPAPAPVTGEKSTLRLPGSPILGDVDAAARVRRSSFEPRPGNAAANQRRPTSSELTSWRSTSNYAGVDSGAFYTSKVTGGFAGTTDEILQWEAWKWGLDEDTVRAQAVQESTWYQSAVGDGGISYGIMQLKSTIQRGTFPLSRDSTPFNVDYAAMILRHCYDGRATWLRNGYAAGDMWGCLGYYYSGMWYDPGAVAYIASVKQHLAQRAWQAPGF